MRRQLIAAALLAALGLAACGEGPPKGAQASAAAAPAVASPPAPVAGDPGAAGPAAASSPQPTPGAGGKSSGARASPSDAAPVSKGPANPAPAAAPPLAPARTPSADRKAAEGVALIKRIAADGGDFRSMGFANREEVRLARLGPSMPVYNVALDALRAYHPGVPTSDLLLPSSETLYLVLVRGQPKSSVSVVPSARGVQLYALGEALTAVRVAPYLRPGRGQQFVVRAPALDGLFLGWRAAGRTLVINLVDEPDQPLPVGQTFPAERALAELSKIAQQVPVDTRPQP